MVTTIAILSLIGMILSLFDNFFNHEKIDVNLLFPAILTIVLWETNITLSIITICITAVIAILGVADNNQ